MNYLNLVAFLQYRGGPSGPTHNISVQLDSYSFARLFKEIYQVIEGCIVRNVAFFPVDG
jgi:hypothetical protein